MIGVCHLFESYLLRPTGRVCNDDDELDVYSHVPTAVHPPCAFALSSRDAGVGA